MFGGHGLFCESVMFALVDRQGGAFLRADDGAQKFRERGGHQHPGMPYWSVPASVVDDHDELVRWASDALAVARSHQRKR